MHTDSTLSTLCNALADGDDGVAIAWIGADGAIERCNAAFARLLQRPAAQLSGCPLSHVVGSEQATLEILARARAARGGAVRFPLLNLAPRDGVLGVSVVAAIAAAGQGWTLACVVPAAAIGEQAQVGQVVSDLSTLLRERDAAVRRAESLRAELEARLRELQETRWHLRRMQEVLPICVGCGKVRGDGASWQDLVQFMNQHADFLTHGYCPGCFDRAMAEIEAM